MSDKSLKVTDRRMFTPDGELREEYRHLREVPADPASGSAPESVPTTPEARSPDAVPSADRPPAGPPEEPAASEESRQAGPDRAAPGPAGPGFFDLVGLLAEPAGHYMQEAHTAPPQGAAQSLSLARLHIDLLTVLEKKTRGNLTPEEKAMLDDVVYQLRSAFIGLGG